MSLAVCKTLGIITNHTVEEDFRINAHFLNILKRMSLLLVKSMFF
ncbi:hypothetical protein LEP1GSC035_1314 [Leptospira noguchii str. 2007001578]|uniref:Uncharacterized protein n=1 Tax=Leptospira noguchii str. 2007001578 TaxID=1049974 RepID=A0ABP2T2R5_9LEPT|nr:hypothetical protein LEP1GSC035_1314 [Leptospira noguchii str. 2007001578]